MIRLKRASKDGYDPQFCATTRCKEEAVITDASRNRSKHDVPLCEKHWQMVCQEIPVNELEQARMSAEQGANEAEIIHTAISQLEISSQDDLEFAVSAAADLIKQRKKFEEQRNSIIEKQKDVITRVKNLFAPAINHLSAAEGFLRETMREYRRKCDEQHRKLLDVVASAISESSPEKAEDAIALAESIELKKVDGLTWRETQSLEITDEPALVQWCVENRPDLLHVKKADMLALLKKGTPAPVGCVLITEIRESIYPDKVKNAD